MPGPGCTDPDCHANAAAAAHAWADDLPRAHPHGHPCPIGCSDSHPHDCTDCFADADAYNRAHADDDPTADTAY